MTETRTTPHVEMSLQELQLFLQGQHTLSLHQLSQLARCAIAQHYVTPEVAAQVGLTLTDLKHCLNGAYRPNEEQLAALARRIGVNVNPEPAP